MKAEIRPAPWRRRPSLFLTGMNEGYEADPALDRLADGLETPSHARCRARDETEHHLGGGGGADPTRGRSRDPVGYEPVFFYRPPSPAHSAEPRAVVHHPFCKFVRS